MKAAQINEYGDASVVQVTEIEKPIPQKGKVLVEVHASSINPYDSAVRAGYVQQTIPLRLPITLGGDIAGKVVQIGEGVTGFEVGESIYGQAAVVTGNSGAFAEYAVTAATQIAKAPRNIDFLKAASLPLVGSSAVQALYTHLTLQPGQKILITGGTGGIGSIAIQIAAHLGAAVTATATGDGLRLAEQLGASDVIDYKTDDFSKLSKDFDAIYDTVGGDSFKTALSALKSGGTAVTMLGETHQALAQELGVTILAQMTKVTTQTLTMLCELVESGVVTPQVAKVFNLEDISEAFRRKERGDIQGKVVIAIH
jgi:NADPH:quinone reductase-like Zn-dependent oxidoreductase